MRSALALGARQKGCLAAQTEKTGDRLTNGNGRFALLAPGIRGPDNVTCRPGAARSYPQLGQGTARAVTARDLSARPRPPCLFVFLGKFAIA